ncbi:MAG: homing endonuclease associated repeat-containing protein [Halobaculum sp.]
MATDEQECLDALREAADRLGESPSKAAYESLDVTPASATIVRTVGSWNEAKRRAGLSTAASTGSRTEPKPDDVTLPDGDDWDDLSVDQRWHYRNSDWNGQRDYERKQRLRAWVYDQKRAAGCADCTETDPRCLDFHHRTDTEKDASVARLINDCHGRERIATEIEKCTVLCANCHRKRHLDFPTPGDDSQD